MYICTYMYIALHIHVVCTFIYREYFVSKIFRIFIFRMYTFSYVRTLLFTNTVYFHIPVNFRIYKFRTHTVIRKFL